jgi:hypothetical protein
VAAKFTDEILLIVILLLRRVEFRSVPVDGHKVVSFSGRKPYIPCFNGMLRGGGCSITLLGDVQGDVEVGHISDMGTDLLTKEQFTDIVRFVTVCASIVFN